MTGGVRPPFTYSVTRGMWRWGRLTFEVTIFCKLLVSASNIILVSNNELSRLISIISTDSNDVIVVVVAAE